MEIWNFLKVKNTFLWNKFSRELSRLSRHYHSCDHKLLALQFSRKGRNKPRCWTDYNHNKTKLFNNIISVANYVAPPALAGIVPNGGVLLFWRKGHDKTRHQPGCTALFHKTWRRGSCLTSWRWEFVPGTGNRCLVRNKRQAKAVWEHCVWVKL